MFDRVSYMKAYNKAYYSKNKVKELKRHKKYRLENDEKIKDKRKEWWAKKGKQYRLENIDKIRLSARKYARRDRKENTEKYEKYRKSKRAKEIQKKYRKNRILNINQKLRQTISNRIKDTLKYQQVPKTFPTLKLIGCSIKQAREHIEKQFKDDMNWDNHGTVWEIDHIKPISSFNLENVEEQLQAYNFKNLQPLYWKENRIKSNRIVI